MGVGVCVCVRVVMGWAECAACCRVQSTCTLHVFLYVYYVIVYTYSHIVIHITPAIPPSPIPRARRAPVSPTAPPHWAASSST